MLDLSAKNVVVAVRLYAPTASDAPSLPASSLPSPPPLSAPSSTPFCSATPVPLPAVATTVSEDRETAALLKSEEPRPEELRPLQSEREGTEGSQRISVDTENVEKPKGGAEKEESPTRKGDEVPSPKGAVLRTPVLPVQRIILSTEDLVLSFGRAGRRRRRVLGR